MLSSNDRTSEAETYFSGPNRATDFLVKFIQTTFNKILNN